MSSFTIGEEVHYRGQRFVVSQSSDRQPLRYRLLATTPEGAKVVWAPADALEKIARYTRPVNDTNR